MSRSLSGFGEAYERRLSAAQALRLCQSAGKPLPKVGWEQPIATARHDEFAVPWRLVVMNVSGRYCLACSAIEAAYWPEIFNIDPENLP